MGALGYGGSTPHTESDGRASQGPCKVGMIAQGRISRAGVLDVLRPRCPLLLSGGVAVSQRHHDGNETQIPCLEGGVVGDPDGLSPGHPPCPKALEGVLLYAGSPS